MSIYLFNRIIDQPDSITNLLYLISRDPSFEQRINKFWSIFPKTSEGHINRSNFIDIFTNVYTFIQPQFSFTQQRLFAEQKVAKLINNGQYIYKALLQIFLQICSQMVQTIDLRSILSFMDILWQRIINLSIIKIDGSTQQVLTQTMLFIYHKDQIEKHCVGVQKRLNLPIYYQESIKYLDKPQQNTATQSLVYSLKPQSQIIPMGYICQSVISTLVNTKFQFKQTYTLIPQQRIKLNNVQINVRYEDKALDPIRDSLINKQTMYFNYVMKQGLAIFQFGGYSTNIECYRITQYLSRQCYFQQLKTNSEHKGCYLCENQQRKQHLKFCNILSSFHDRSEFDIDEIENVRDKWQKKRNNSLLHEEKKVPSKVVINVEEESKTFSMKIAEKNDPHLNTEKIQTQITFLKQKLKQILQQQRVINLQKYLSRVQSLPSENNDTFSEDLYQYCKLTPLQLLITGRPKCGKSLIAKQIAKKYNLIYVSIENSINKLFERIKFFEQNPSETDEDGNPLESLTPFQKYLQNEFENGKFPNQQDLIDLLNKQLRSIEVQTQGFILDLPFESYNWVDKIKNNQLYTPKVRCSYFSHVIELQQTEEEWKWFIKGLKQHPQRQTITSGYQRYIITKPKPVSIEGQEQEQQQEDQNQDDEQKPPLVEQQLIPLQINESKLPQISCFTDNMHPRSYLKVPIAGKNALEIIDLLSLNLYRIPLAKKIEGSQKDLLSIGLEQQKVFRKWSPWGIVDPIELFNGKLLNGKAQFAAQYAGRVFLFENQINQETFIKSPTKFINKPPKLPSQFNIVINGPPKSGKKTLATQLASIYGFKIVNIEQIVTQILEQQKNFAQPIPSNFDPRSDSIHLSQPQWKQFNKGVPLNPKDIIPIVLHKLGIKLQKKPQDWGIQRTEQQLVQLQRQREQKQRQQLLKKTMKKTKKKQTKQPKQQQNKIPPLQDLHLSNIIPELNYLNKIDQIRGYIFIGYPTTQDQLNSFKAFNIPIDKYVLLNEINEQNPNKVLKTRLNDAELEQTATFLTLVSVVKDTLGEEIVKQFNIDDTVEGLIVKTRSFIDPFVLKVDEDQHNRVLADKEEEGDPVPAGFCGQYCPVILEEGWLLKGKDEFQCGVRGKRFKFFQQKQLNKFKQDPSRYLTTKHQKVPPRIMMMGIRGVGLKTQLMKINRQTKIPILNFKDNLLSHIQNQKIKRRTERYYNRGFKISQQQGQQENPDADLDQESPEFDQKQTEIQVTKTIFNGIQQILINGNFYDIPQEIIQTPFVELLAEAHRLPEAVVIMKVDEKRLLHRIFNPKDVEKQHQQLVRQATEQRQKQKQEARQAALEAEEQYQQPQQQPELDVTPLQTLMTQAKDRLIEQRNNDLAQMEEYAQKFRQNGVHVIEIDCQRDIDNVFDKIIYQLKPFLNNRIERWEKLKALKIQPERIKDFLDNYIVKESRFGRLNPLSLKRPLKPYPLIYKDRLYYLDNQEQRDMVFENLFLLKQKQSIPKDVITTPIIYIIGKPKTGKSELSRIISKKLGLVRISFRRLVEQFTEDHKDSTVQKVLNSLRFGGTISDEQIVSLISKRVQMRDCQQKGWILDGFPYTKTQADLLIKNNLAPYAVFSLQFTTTDLKKRVSGIPNPQYSYNPVIFSQRVNQSQEQLHLIQNFFMNKYNNIRFLDGKISKWGIFETAKNYFNKVLQCRQNATRDLLCKQPVQIMDLGISYNTIISNLSDYKNYCIVTFRSQREYVKCELKQPRFLSLYKQKIYLLANAKELNDFCKNPDLYIQQPKTFFPPEMILPHQLLQKYKTIYNKGYCMIELSKGKLLKGYPLLSIEYKDKIYGMGNSHNAKLFMKNPMFYEMATLQDKLPVQLQKKNQLKKIAKRNDCTAFLEHHLGNILMRVLAQLGYRRLKYPTVSSKQTALKFLAISLKASNPNKDEKYREKYKDKLQKFIKHCNYSQDLKNEYERKQKLGSQKWTDWDEQNLLKLSQQYYQFMNQLSSSEKAIYFSQFIS